MGILGLYLEFKVEFLKSEDVKSLFIVVLVNLVRKI